MYKKKCYVSAQSAVSMEMCFTLAQKSFGSHKYNRINAIEMLNRRKEKLSARTHTCILGEQKSFLQFLVSFYICASVFGANVLCFCIYLSYSYTPVLCTHIHALPSYSILSDAVSLFAGHCYCCCDCCSFFPARSLKT